MTEISTAPRARLDTTRLEAVAARGAQQAERQRRLGDETVAAIRAAGFGRHFVAREYGGTQGTFGDLGAAVVATAAACPSSAWLASLSAYSARFAAHLPSAAARALWGDSPDVVVATGLAPSGTATRAGDHFIVNGAWRYVSGCDVADWLLLCARVDGTDDELRFVAVPRSRARIDPTWDSIGMSATSSDTVHLADVCVSEDFTFARIELLRGVNPNSDLPVHNIPFQAVGGATFLGPVVGAALGAVEAYAAWLANGTPSAEAKRVLVRAAAQTDGAAGLFRANLAVLDARDFTPAAMARNERNAVSAAETCRLVVNDLVAAAGTAAFSVNAPLQRFWRDVHVGASHIALRYETAALRTYPASRGVQ